MSTSVQTVILAAVIAAGASAALIATTLPWLRRNALAHVNARSSHTIPTPQGAGIGVVIATLGTVGLMLTLAPSTATPGVLMVLAAAAVLAIVGIVDDFRSIPILRRLLLQAAAVALMLAAMPATTQIAPFLPLWAERTILFLAALWFVNLVNFMDGIDWITVAEVLPVTAALAAFGLAGQLSAAPTLVAAALCGAFAGFAPFNRPVAKIFLGDVGSLPTGLLLAWCLFDLATHGHLAAALLLPLYYLTDATLTLLRRLSRGEKVWLAHRSHFYQQATDNGFSVERVVTHVFALNLALAALAALAAAAASFGVQIAAFIAGLAAVGFVLRRFARPHV